jgi:predicted TIM-barrel fold metal-dependent hydrolase
MVRAVSAPDCLYADALAPFQAEVERLRPADAEVFDAHTHLGLDEDGRSLTLPQLLSQLDDAGARRACVFPLHDPERSPAYRLPNDRVLAWAGESEGRLIPFCRLDPAEDPVAEGERCLAAGARGIKLHPRAQAFGFDSTEMEGIFALAEAAKAPILIHAGRGLPPLGDELVELTLRHPDVVLILAHGAICDQGIITSRLADHPGVLYDISCFFPLDVIELLARAPIERIVFASDPPYGLPATSLYMALRVAAQAGLDEAAVRGMLGGTVAGLFDGHGLPPVTPPRRGSTITLSGRLARVYGYGSLAGPAMFAGSPEQAHAMLDMALAACRDPDPGTVGDALERIETALRAADAMLLLQSEAGTGAAIDLVYRAIVRAATELPDRSSTPG